MLDINKNYKKIIIIFSVATLFCIVFDLIYTALGRGMSSNHLKYMFLYPLLMGDGVYTLLHIAKFNNVKGANLYNASIITFVIYNIMSGIFKIAGTDSNYISWYLIAGVILLIGAIVEFVVGVIKGKK